MTTPNETTTEPLKFYAVITYADNADRLVQHRVQQGVPVADAEELYYGNAFVRIKQHRPEGLPDKVSGSRIDFPIPEAKSIVEAFEMFDDVCKAFLKNIQEEQKRPKIATASQMPPTIGGGGAVVG